MTRAVVTGARGFIGRNLCLALSRRPDVDVLPLDLDDGDDAWSRALGSADVVYHLAGVNRPSRVEEFTEVNVGLTRGVVERLQRSGRGATVVLASSTQAAVDNPYGASKRQAEEVVASYASRSEARARIYRLPGVFGRWSRPNYNSVTATFCHNVARDVPITVSDPAREIVLVHVDDVVAAFLDDATGAPPGITRGEVAPEFRVTLGRLSDLIHSFRDSRRTLLAPDMGDPLIRRLYGTYLSYLPQSAFAYDLAQRADARGVLSELLKAPGFGQIFVSRTLPGVTRGNHYHDVKVEKFCVLEGRAVIRFRPVLGGDVLEYPVAGQDFRVVDIPPGYTHSIENVGTRELVVLFWAGEIFDPQRPDTYACPVKD